MSIFSKYTEEEWNYYNMKTFNNLVVCITIPSNYEIIDITPNCVTQLIVSKDTDYSEIIVASDNNLESIRNNKIIQSNCDLYQIESLSSKNIVIKFQQIE
jgi:hypothetical protein